MAKQKFSVKVVDGDYKKTMSPVLVEIECDPKETIAAFNRMVHDKAELNTLNRSIYVAVFNGGHLDDKCTLAQSNIESGSTICVVTRTKSKQIEDNAKLPPKNKGTESGLYKPTFDGLIGLGVSLGYCLWSAHSNSHLGTSFGSRLLEVASSKVCLGIVLTSVILGAGAAYMKGESSITV